MASILEATTTPPPGTSRWTSRALARHLGVSHSTVLRVWRDAGADSDSRTPRDKLGLFRSLSLSLAYRAEQGVGFHPAAPGNFLKSELVRYGRVK